MDELKVFIAAPYPLKDLAKGHSKFIESHGIEVVSRWHNVPPLKDYKQAALDDIYDLDRANTFVILKDNDLGNGGKDIEFGYAIAKGYNLCVVSYSGPKCIYDYLEQVTVVPTQSSVINWLDTLNE